MASPITTRQTAQTMTITYREVVGEMKSSRPQLVSSLLFMKMMSYEFGIIGVHMCSVRFPSIAVAAKKFSI